MIGRWDAHYTCWWFDEVDRRRCWTSVGLIEKHRINHRTTNRKIKYLRNTLRQCPVKYYRINRDSSLQAITCCDNHLSLQNKILNELRALDALRRRITCTVRNVLFATYFTRYKRIQLTLVYLIIRTKGWKEKNVYNNDFNLLIENKVIV